MDKENDIIEKTNKIIADYLLIYRVLKAYKNKLEQLINAKPLKR